MGIPSRFLLLGFLFSGMSLMPESLEGSLSLEDFYDYPDPVQHRKLRIRPIP